jgi:hypothetical protein
MYTSGLSFAALQAEEINGEQSHRAPSQIHFASQYHEQSKVAVMLHIRVRALSIYLGQDLQVVSSEELPRRKF